jgi:hypothetical protein
MLDFMLRGKGRDSLGAALRDRFTAKWELGGEWAASATRRLLSANQGSRRPNDLNRITPAKTIHQTLFGRLRAGAVRVVRSY